MLSVANKHILLSVVRLNVIRLNVVGLNVVRLNVVRLNVVAPFNKAGEMFQRGSERKEVRNR
jgi:hypothetical protein